MGERAQWDSNLAFLMAMIGSAVGLGNIWRFPYIFYTNGQGSFLIPYIVAILVLGLPFLLLEYSLGFKYKDTLVNILDKINSKFKIIAYVLMVVVFAITCYYVCIVGWDLIYLVLSFTKAWGANPDAFFASTVLNIDAYNNGIFQFVPIVAISVILIWGSCWIIARRGVNKGIGVFSKYAVPLLFALIIIIVCYSVTLPGASVGFMRFLDPDWSMLLKPSMWLAAFGQIIFSLSIGMGISLTYASYLPEDTNLTKNAVSVIFANCGFEVFNVIGVFAILGFMTTKTGVPFDNLITGGTGLAFVAYPNVFNVMGSTANILGPLFFLCLLIAGLTSLISLVETLVATVVDSYGISRNKAINIFFIAGVLISLIFASSYADIAITTVDFIANNVALVLLIAFECIIFTHRDDVNDLIEILNRNTLFKVGNWWKYIVQYILPILLVIFRINGLFDMPVIESRIFIILAIIALVIVVIPVVGVFIKDIIAHLRKNKT